MKYLLTVGAIALAGCQPTAPPSTNPQGGVVAQMPVTQGSSMTGLMNSVRTAQGYSRVTENARLSQAARAHAIDMVRNDYFSHVGRNGSAFTDRARAAGYTCVAAENIAVGQNSEEAVMTAWVNSPGHLRNILKPDVREYGIGREGNMWVMMLGRGC